MLDSAIRSRIERPLDKLGAQLSARGISPAVITFVGLALGILCCAAIVTEHWTAALVLWLGNRAADGLDGPVARNGTHGPSDFGGFVDILADFAIYGGVLVAVGYAIPDARLAALAVLCTYYLNGSAFLAWSSLAEKRAQGGGERSLQFPAGLAEGTETIVAYVILLLWSPQAAQILWVWAAIVGVTVIQRVVFVGRNLRP
ncbi:MAG: CDP-alcohol phosphatidyltransferase family protein [Acidimicrobiales bacterium]|nr:CDP-alcohol phosphatidyltransferase family protein [Acidimicrobiales bacterium]